jgi:hypothetical protein
MWGNAAGSSGVEVDVSLAFCLRNKRGSTEGLYLTEAALFLSLLRCELLLHRSSVECTLLTDDGANQRESGAKLAAREFGHVEVVGSRSEQEGTVVRCEVI